MRKILASCIQSISRCASDQVVHQLRSHNRKCATLFIETSQLREGTLIPQESVYRLWCLYEQTGHLLNINIEQMIAGNDFWQSQNSTQLSALSLTFYLDVRPLIDIIVESRSDLLYKQDRSYSCPIFWVLHRNDMALLGRILKQEPGLLFYQFKSPKKPIKKESDQSDLYQSIWHYAAKIGNLNAVACLIKGYRNYPASYMTQDQTFFWKQFANFSAEKTYFGTQITALLKQASILR